MHLRYGRQLVEKQRWVSKILTDAQVSASVMSRIRPSEPQQRYAHSTQWFFSEVSGEPHFGPAGEGLKERMSEPPTGCVLPPRSVTRVLSVIYDAFLAARRFNPGYSIYQEKRGFGTLKSVMVICTRPPRIPSGPSTEILINLVLAHAVDDAAEMFAPLVRAAKKASPRRLVGFVVNVARAKRALMGGRLEALLYGRRFARQSFEVEVHGEPREFVLEFGAGSRLATHTRSLGLLSREVLKACDLGPTDVAWHCFCGGGELALALGAHSEHVVAIGTSAAEVAELKRNLKANDISNTTAVLANLRSPWTLLSVWTSRLC